MSSYPEWAEAEDAFLSLACRLTHDEHTVRFESPQNASRFNGVRIVNVEALDEAGWHRVLERHAEAFAAREMPLSVQLAQPLSGDSLPGDWREVGAVYDHVATDIADFARASSKSLRLETVDTDEQIGAFVEMMMPGRIPETMREQARPGVLALTRKAVDDPSTAVMLAYDDARLVGQLALVRATGERANGYTVTTLSVALSARGEGYMKAMYAALPGSFEGQLYGQIILGTPTMAYRRRFPSTRLLATVGRYQRVDDVYGDRWSN